MLLQPFRRIRLLAIPVVLLVIALAVSCKKVSTSDPGKIPSDTLHMPDFTSMVTSTISGFVTEHGSPVKDVNVRAGTGFEITDTFGYFEIKNILIIRDVATVSFSKAGFVSVVKTFVATEGKGVFLRPEMIPRQLSYQTVDATQMSYISGPEISVQLQPNSLASSTSQALYSGTAISRVDYYLAKFYYNMRWILPGDNRGLDIAGNLKHLSIFNLASIQLEASAGNELSLAAGKTASVVFGFAGSLPSDTAVSLPLWGFDDVKGLWIQKGYATKSADGYVGVIDHLGYWCCAMASTPIHFTATITDKDGKPLPFTRVITHKLNDPFDFAEVFSDETGFISTTIMANARVLADIPGAPVCNSPVAAKTIVSGYDDILEENINVPPQNVSTISGSVLDCKGYPVTSGSIIMQAGAYALNYRFTASPSFKFNIVACTDPAQPPITFYALDHSAKQTGNPLTATAVGGQNLNLGALSTCGTTIFVKVNYRVTDASGTALPWAWVSFVNKTTGDPRVIGFTDNNGDGHADVKENCVYTLQIAGSRNCNNYVYTQNVSTSNVSLDIGTIKVAGMVTSTITGKVVGCNNSFVTSGYVIMQKDSQRVNYPLSATGTFNIPLTICSAQGDSVLLIPVDNTTSQAGAPFEFLLTSNINDVGAIAACTSTDPLGEYIIYTVDGTNYSYLSPPNSYDQTLDPNTHFMSIFGYPSQPNANAGVYISFYAGNIGLGSILELNEFYTPQLSWSIIPPIYINIAEFGNIGGYISGNFRGQVQTSPSDPTPRNVTCSFRVKRKQ